MKKSRPNSAASEAQRVLVVDDEPWVRESIAGFLKGNGFDCETASTGSEALAILRGEPFQLLISDINMPGLDGLELFQKVSRSYPEVAVIMLTGVVDVATAVEIMRAGAYDYITKPMDLDQVLSSARRALSVRRERRKQIRQAQQLRRRIEEHSEALSRAETRMGELRMYTLSALVRSLDAREHETQAHSSRVQAYTMRLARQFPIEESELEDLGLGALLHDVGKIGVPDAILGKAGKLTDKEWTMMRRHPEIGAEILGGMDFLEGAIPVVLHHHEQFDGSGYPSGLKGLAIPLAARLFSVIDAYDALTSDRPYRRGVSPATARRRISELAGTQFDSQVVEKFLEIPEDELEEIRRTVE